MVSESVWYPFSTTAPGTVTFTGIYFDIYSTVDKMTPSFGYSVSSFWSNTQKLAHSINFKDIYLTMSIQNYQVKRINMFVLDLSSDTYHMQNISISK